MSGPDAPPAELLRLRRITFIDAIGTGAFTAASVVIFTQAFGLSTRAVSTALAISGAVSAAMLLPVGRLVDRTSVRTAMITTNIILVAATALLFLHPDEWLLAAVLGVLALGMRTVSVVRGVVLGRLTGPERTAQRARNRTAFNLGLAIGGFAAAGLVALGSRSNHGPLLSVIGLDIASYAACAIASLPLDRVRPEARTGRIFSVAVLGDGRFLLACVANTVASLHNGLLFVAMPLWIAASHTIPVVFIPVITLINVGLVVALQRRLAGDADGVRAGAALQAKSSWVLLAGCLVIFAGQHLPLTAKCAAIVVAAVLWSVTEMWQAAAGWAIAYDLSPPERLAEYQALFQVSANLEQVLGPVLAAAVILALPQGVGWLVVGAGVLVVVLAVQAALIRVLGHPEVSTP